MSAPAWAALFDWDGVVIDSAAAHLRSWELLAEEEGRPLPADHFLRGFGKRNEVIFPDILGWTSAEGEIRRLSLRKEELYREVVSACGVRVLPGARIYLESLRRAGIPCVVGTSTQRANVEMLFAREGLGVFFLDVVASEDVTRGKPDPEVFLKAAARAGLPPVDCVVFEDAPYGIDAAKAGGMGAVGLLTTHPAEHLRGADRFVHQLDELPLDGRHPLR
jgi:HAD superfamily hydrolase (TIGR01509 family)